MLLLCRVEDDFSGDPILFDDPVSLRSVAQGHDPIDDGADFSLMGGVERFFDVRRVGPGGADDAQTAHVEALYVEGNGAAAMSAGCHQPSIESEAGERRRP